MDLIRDAAQFNDILSLSEEVLSRNDLAKLKSLNLISSSERSGSTSTQLIQLNPPSKKSIENQFAPILGALHHLETSLAYIIRITPQKTECYLAFRAPNHSSAVFELVKTMGICDFKKTSGEIASSHASTSIIYENLINPKQFASLTSVTINPISCSIISPSHYEKFTALIKTLKEQECTLLFLANPSEKKIFDAMIYQLEHLFTLFDTFKETTFTYHHTHSDSFTNNKTQSKATTLTEAKTQTKTQTFSIENDCKNTDSLFINYKVNDKLSYVINNQPFKASEKTDVQTNTCSETNTSQDALTDSSTDGKTNSKGHNNTFCFKGENKTAETFLKKIKTQLSILYQSEYKPQFQFNLYLLSSQLPANLLMAFKILDLLVYSKEERFQSYVTTWTKEDEIFEGLITYLSNLQHPSFQKPRSKTFVSPASFMDVDHLSHLIYHLTAVLE